MKNEEIYTAWTEFINDDKYKEYFLSNEEQWYYKLGKVKEFMNTNNTRPNKRSKNKDTKIMGYWIGTQTQNYKAKKKIMLNEEIYNAWTKFINDDNDDHSRYIKVLAPKFKVTYETQDTRAVRFMPRFENVQAKTILGIKFSATFIDSFGDTVFEFSGLHEDKLHYKEYTTTQLSFSFLEMHDRANEPFEILYPLAALDNSNILISVKAISFMDGDIIEF